MASLPDVEPRPISVAEYHRMIDAGILSEDERVELLEGVIVKVSPQGDPHALVIERLNKVLVRQLPDRYRVRPQLPLPLGDRSEPEPDLAVSLAEVSTAKQHPRTALLVIEVAGESLRKDRRVKARIYARAGIPEYWLVNLDESCLEVFTEPESEAGEYRQRTLLARNATARSSAVPELLVPLAEVFD